MINDIRLTIVLALTLSFAMPVYSGEHIEEHHGINYRVAQFLEEHGIPPEAVIVMISTLPIVELRGAIPVAHFMEMNGWLAYILAVLGNMIPVIPILLFLGPVSKFLMRFKPGEVFFNWLFARTRRKSTVIEKYETLGLILFVAIPLPVTGAWTGCAAAFLFGFGLARAVVCILLGVMISGTIMTILSVMGWLGAIIAGTVLFFLIIISVLSKFKSA